MTNDTQKNTITTDLVFRLSYDNDQSLENGMKKIGIQIEHVDCGDPTLDQFADLLGTVVADFLEKYPDALSKIGNEMASGLENKENTSED